MKKRFLKIALLSLVSVSMPMSFTSCKDYDDDITNINENADGLQKQISTLEQAINELKGQATAAAENATKAAQAAQEAKQAAAAAQQAGDDAAAEAQKALAEAQEAKQLAALAQEAAANAKAEALAEAKAWATDLLNGKASQEDLNALGNRIAALEEKLNNLTPGQTPEVPDYSDAIAALQTQIDALKGYATSIEALQTADNELKAKIEAEIAAVNSAISSINTTMEGLATTASVNEIKNSLNNVTNLVTNIQATLLTLQTDQLTSLVFKPTFYYQGIEAMWAPTFVFPELGVKAVNADGNFATDAPVVGDSVRMTPDLVAEYHINPSSAILPENIAMYSFTNTIGDKDYSRAENKGVPTPTIYAKEASNGILTVHANLKDGMIKNIVNDNKVTVLALQVKVATGANDTIVTSDYAALKALYTRDLVLADASQASHQPHWPTTMAEAIASTDPIEIAWNDNQGINIAEYVNTHYSVDGKGNDIVWDKNAASGTVEKSGFAYSYQLVGYQLGENKTSESAHAALKGSWIRPQMTKDGKQQPWGAAQSEASIDREPIVRVVLTDTVSNAIAAVGYIKFQIVPDTKESTAKEVASFTFNTPYTVQCSQVPFYDKLTWWQVEEQIIEALGISKTEFETDYKPDFVTPQEAIVEGKNIYELVQYNGTGVDAQPLKSAQYVGKIGMSTYDDQPTETNILAWSISGAQAYDLFYTQKKTTTSAIVRFTKTVVVNASTTHPQTVYHYVYVTINWTPSQLNVTPQGTISDNVKINEMWYEAWSPNHGGFAEVHMNVAVPEDNATDAANCTYVGHMLYPFKDEMKLAISGVDGIYKGYQDADLTKYFQFTTPDVATAKGVSGNVYALGVSNDGLALTATLLDNQGNEVGETLKIAVISTPNTSSYTEWGKNDVTVTYQTNNYAMDILNTYEHNQLKKGETVAGKVLITAFNNCGELPLTNNTYNLRFLRPVNMDVATGAEMVDAKNSGSTIKLADFLSFTDWRSEDPISFFSTHENYFSYYGFTEIVIGKIKPETLEVEGASNGNVNGIVTTNLGGSQLGTTVLSSVTPNMDLIYTPATTLGQNDMGTLTYYNNGENINKAFQIQVPVVAKYKWGWLTGNLVITVNKTLGN